MKQYHDLAAKLLRELCVIPAPSHQEDLRAAYCAEKLREFGFTDVFVDEAQNVICEIRAAHTDKTVVFAAHTDVVFPDTEPLPLREDATNLYCPGGGDDTVCVAQLMSVMKWIKDTGKQPRYNTVFVFNSCEEGLGNLKGIRAVMERYGSSVIAFFTFDGQFNAVVDRSVGSHRYKVTVRTKGGHSFNDFGNENAARVLAKGIQMIYEIPLPEVVKTTCNVGLISGGTSVNTIPQEASMLCEYRSESSQNLSYMKEAFGKVFAAMAETAQVEVELVGDRPGMKDVDPDAQKALSDLCASIQQKHGGIEPVRNSGSTDCNIPHSMGIPAVCAGTYLGGGAHTREEWVEKASIPVGIEIIADIMLTYFS